MGLKLNSYIKKSITITKPKLTEDSQEQRVLVVGGDWIGEEIASRLQKIGLDVTLSAAIATSDADQNQSAPLLTGPIDGQIGQFQATFIESDNHTSKPFGFVIAAQPAKAKERFNLYGLKQSQRVITVSKLLALINEGQPLPERVGEWYHIAFIDDLIGDSEPTVLSQFVDCIERLKSIDKLQAYVFTRHLKVAGPHLEDRYRKLRENGVIFFKFDNNLPTFETQSDSYRILFEEPLLKQDFELTPDLLVIDEELRPPEDLKETFGQLVPFEISEPYLQTESPRFNSVLTSKAGVFAVGPTRGIYDRQSIIQDIETVEFQVKKILDHSKDSRSLAPVVDKSKCAVCLTCVRLCPHGAISFSDSAIISVPSCQNCGICIAECPMGAIAYSQINQLVGANTSNIVKEFNFEDCAGKIVLFLCSRSAAQAFKSIEFIYKDDVVVFEVNCAGSLQTKTILDALNSQASAVLVGGCFKGNCASVYGNILCDNRIQSINQAITGLESNPVGESGKSLIPAGTATLQCQEAKAKVLRFVQTAGNTPEVLMRAISSISQELSDL